jgi:hypothetical protein
MSLEGYPHIPPFTYIDYHLVTYPHLPSRAIANVARQTAVSFAATRRSRSPYGGSLGCSLADRICPLPQWPRRDVLFIADRDSILLPYTINRFSVQGNPSRPLTLHVFGLFRVWCPSRAYISHVFGGDSELDEGLRLLIV